MYGVWTLDNGDVELIDADKKHMPIDQARAQARKVLADKEKTELLAMLVDRLDVEDLIRYVADANGKFLPTDDVPEGRAVRAEGRRELDIDHNLK